jgi:hypothetical protein
VSGDWYLVELVNPRKMVQRAPGTLTHAASISFGGGGTGTDSTDDNFIQDGAKNRNHGTHTVHAFGWHETGSANYRAHMKWPKFDEGGDFDADEIDSCRCSLYVYANVGGWNDSVYFIHEGTTVGDRNYWDEGTGSGPNWDGIPDWDSVLTPDTLWTAAGGDFKAAAFDTLTFPSAAWYVINIPKTLCSLWVAKPDTNQGFFIKTPSEDGNTTNWIRYSYSSENGSNKPRLTVWYTLPPPVATMIYPTGGSMRGFTEDSVVVQVVHQQNVDSAIIETLSLISGSWSTVWRPVAFWRNDFARETQGTDTMRFDVLLRNYNDSIQFRAIVFDTVNLADTVTQKVDVDSSWWEYVLISADTYLDSVAEGTEHGDDVTVSFAKGTTATNVYHMLFKTGEISQDPAYTDYILALDILSDNETPGPYSVHAFRTGEAWVEADANWDTAQSGTEWTTPGGTEGAVKDTVVIADSADAHIRQYIPVNQIIDGSDIDILLKGFTTTSGGEWLAHFSRTAAPIPQTSLPQIIMSRPQRSLLEGFRIRDGEIGWRIRAGRVGSRIP